LKFEVLLTDEATKDFNSLERIERKKVLKAFDIIEKVDISATETRPLTEKLFEIKADNVRAVYVYTQKRIIVVGLIFVKKTQKTPTKFINKAEKILQEYIK
jgi:phage-related protein